jgi:hypothetical protein
MAESKSVADFEGAWIDPPFASGLVERCQRYWNTPISELPDLMVATYINQKLALEQMQVEARRRIDSAQFDGSEFYDGQLADALRQSECI